MRTLAITKILLILISTSTFSKMSVADAILDCYIHTYPFETWVWNHKCELEITNHPDIPGITDFSVTHNFDAMAYKDHPNWSFYYNAIESPNVASGVARVEELGLIFMNSYASINIWTAKYENYGSFNDPYLWAPIEVHGWFYYKINGVWNYYQPATAPSSHADNLCASSCGAAAIPYPGTP